MKLQIVKRVPRLPPRKADSHKGDYGRVLVIGGSRGMIGAPALCANAALRSGAGLVRIAVEALLQERVAVLAPCATTIDLPMIEMAFRRPRQKSWYLPEDVEHDVWSHIRDAQKANDVLAVGPGWSTGRAHAALLGLMLAKLDGPMVLDADGLNNLTQIPGWVRICAQRTPKHPLVLTPHPGEMQRLLDSGGIKLDAVKQRRASALQLAAKTGAVVVLKGAGTVVTDGRRMFVNRTGNPGMATGGTGDVLTGVIAALIGQKMSPFDAAVLGVHVHGLAGDLAARTIGQVSLIATDLIEHLPAAFLKMRR